MSAYTSISDLQKVPAHMEITGLVSVIIKTNTDLYIPPQVALRTRISPNMFTANMLGEHLDEVRANPQVQSVALSEALPTVFNSPEPPQAQ